MVLLFGVGRSGWQRRDMPMNVVVPLVAAETEDVEPLGWHDGTDGSTHPVHEALQLEVLIDVEILEE